MKKLKTSVELLMPHIFILTLLVLGTIVSLVSFTKIKNQMEALYKGPFAIKNAAGTVSKTLEAMQTSVFRAISNDSQDITNEAISEARNHAELLQEQISQLKQYSFGDMGALARLEANSSELMQMQEYVLVLIAENKNSEAAAHMENNNIPVINEAQKELAQFIQSVEAREQELMASLRQAQRNAIFFLIALGTIGTLFAVRDGAYFWRSCRELRQNKEQYHPEKTK